MLESWPLKSIDLTDAGVSIVIYGHNLLDLNRGF